ncbi:hypothetical protein BJ912DRAFT_430414 [Pholiota molesta]|nr:hypothetical protein BJ912DRAFT_430414 [Pholiota molesta]
MHDPLSFSIKNTNATVEETRQLIDEAIERCQNTILALRSQRNDVASTSCLPPEILTRIFWFAQSEDQSDQGEEDEGDEEDEKPSDGPSFLKWIRLTHVCRHWRNVAINSPTLWVNPPLGNLPWAEEMLKRSKEASLVIKADISPGVPVTPGLKLALKHGSRVKDLSIRNVNLEQWNDLQEELPKSTPRLEFLSLRAAPPAQEWDDSDADDEEWDPIPISKTFLCKTERLRYLELTNCEIDWDFPSSLLSSLTHLKLHLLPEISRLTSKHFVDALRGMPNLEHLELDEALPLAIGSDSVHLASLRYLSIHSINTEAEHFFRCVTFPPEASISVDCYSTFDSSTSFSGVIAGLGRSYSYSNLPTQAILQIGPSSKVTLTLFTDEGTDPPNEQEGFYPFTLLSLVFSWETSPVESSVITSVINDMFSGGLPLRNIYGVYLRPMPEDMIGFNPKTLAGTFGSLPVLTLFCWKDPQSGPLSKPYNYSPKKPLKNQNPSVSWNNFFSESVFDLYP